MAEPDTSLHFLFVSFPGQGHVNPFLRLAKRIASKGPLVTFSTTIDFGSRIRSASQSPFPTNSDSDLIPVGLGFLRFEFFNEGLDTTDPGDNLSKLMRKLDANGPSALTDLIHRQSAAGRPVSCLINNPFIPWALDVGSDLSIPCAVLWIQSCTVFSIYYHFHHRLVDFPTEDNLETHVQLPGIPSMAPDELPTFILPSNPYKSLTEAILAQFRNIVKARWIFANSFDELERDTFKALEELVVVPIIPIGPLVDGGEESLQDKIKADQWKSADHCLDWLEIQKPNSVVYVSVGSVVMLSADEMAEFAFGLRNSGRPFLWVVREDVRELLPEGFEKAVEAEGKAMLVGWSPQEKVLATKSVACFITHCGWNSTLEAIAAGVPVIAYPQWGDQVPNAKFLCDICGIGVRLSAPATREKVENCVAAAIDGEEAVRMKNRAAKWREAAKEAIAVNGSSDQNIEKFVDDVRKWVAGGGRSSVHYNGSL